MFHLILKISGHLLDDEGFLQSLPSQILDLQQEGYLVSVVYGGGKQADERILASGIAMQKIKGRRVTTKQDMEIIQNLFAGELCLKIQKYFYASGLKSCRLCPLDGNTILAEKRKIKNGIDFGFVGDILDLDLELYHLLVKNKTVPLIPALTSDKSGQLLNTNADTISLTLASKIPKSQVILFSNVDGVLDTNQKVIKKITKNDLQNLIDTEIVKDGMRVKMETCLFALENQVEKIQICQPRTGLSLKEILESEVGSVINDK